MEFRVQLYKSKGKDSQNKPLLKWLWIWQIDLTIHVQHTGRIIYQCEHILYLKTPHWDHSVFLSLLNSSASCTYTTWSIPLLFYLWDIVFWFMAVPMNQSTKNSLEFLIWISGRYKTLLERETENGCCSLF